jgi:hypothetical protein
MSSIMPDLRYALRQLRRCGAASATCSVSGTNRGAAETVRSAR